MLKGAGKAQPYTENPDGGWGWMIVLHFFLVSIYFPLSSAWKMALCREAQNSLARPHIKLLAFEWNRGAEQGQELLSVLSSLGPEFVTAKVTGPY